MAEIIFVTGGARSGKSGFAEQRASTFGEPLGYLATAQALDEEMNGRIRLHRERRGSGWHLIEEPIHLSQALEHSDGKYKAILVDCITLWLSNLLFAYKDAEKDCAELIQKDFKSLKTMLGNMMTPVIIVSNEVGQGIVPDNRLARLFRDIAGVTNQHLAALAGEVYVVISGIPLKIK